MPDATAEETAAAAAKKPPPADRVGEELADDASIWPIFDKLAREDDERRTKTWDNGLNNLALFAGLFSAVTTAFIIEAQQDLEPDYAQLTFLVLNATAFGEKPVNQPFVVPSSARTVTCLWVASLILSLSAALIAIMGKDWIGMYTARPVCNLRQWAEMRTYRLLCVERWYMSGVIAAAPVLLHISLLLFGAGLVVFISSDPITHHLTLGLCLAAGVLYLITALSAVIFSASPFKSPATQMIRAALSVFFSHMCSIIYQPKRKPLRTLMCEIHAMVLRRPDGTPYLPGGPVTNRSWYSGLWSAFVATHGTAIAYMRKLPTWVGIVRNNLQLSPVQSRLYSMVSMERRRSFDVFVSSTWTDLPADPRPELLAEALSWLSGASQAPDVFRAVAFALGDLEVGPQVGKYISPALRTRLRAEIRRSWQQVDFLTLSRYVLADRNTLGGPVVDYFQFTLRFDLSKDSALRCEDGLAALIIAHPGGILRPDLVSYFPGQVAQPKMPGFMLPHIQKFWLYATDVSILLANQYRSHIWTTNRLNASNLELHLYETLIPHRRNAYAAAVTVKYGGTAGAIELLTFLCCNGVIDDVTSPAAVELVMELLPRHPIREHRCLPYLFGSGELLEDAWKDKHWSDVSLYCLSASLETSCHHPFGPSSVRSLSDDREFDLALARAVVMLLSPQNEVGGGAQCIKFLFGHLCQSPLPTLPDNNEQPDVIRLILASAALLNITRTPEHSHYPRSVVGWGTAIMAAIIRDLGRRLQDPSTIHDEDQLFAALAHTEVKGPDGETCIWDLGDWLRTRAPEIAERYPSAAIQMQKVYDALGALYPLCEHNQELRALWDRIGYSGPPEDIAYLLDPYLDLGEFFSSAEDPLSREGV